MVDDNGTSSAWSFECIKILVVDEVCIPDIVWWIHESVFSSSMITTQ